MSFIYIYGFNDMDFFTNIIGRGYNIFWWNLGDFLKFSASNHK